MKIRAAAVSHRNSCMHLGGNEISHGRNYGGTAFPIPCNVMEQNGFSVSRKETVWCRDLYAPVVGLRDYPM